MSKLRPLLQRFKRSKPVTSVAETPKRKGLPALFWCSVVYLIIELGFSAQLLVMAGSVITHDQLESIELVGRSLSGIAITLFLISGLVKSKLRWFVKTVAIGFVTLVTIVTVWTLQEMVVMGLTLAMDEDQQARAVVLTGSTGLIRNGHIAIPTMDLSPEALQQPSGLSFIAMFPALALSRESIDDELKPLLLNAAKRSLVLDCDGPIPCLGTPDQFVEEYWPPLKEELRAAYDEYDQARRPVTDPAPEDVEREARKAWDQYQRTLRRRGLDTNTRHHQSVRQNLRQQGLKVSNSWRLDDYNGFKRAVRGKMMETARRQFSNEAFKIFSTYDFSPDLSERQFIALERIQKRVWAKQGIRWSEFDKVPPPLLTPRYSEQQLRQNLYPALIDFYSKRAVDNMFEDTHRSGSWHKRSLEAGEGLVAVPLALAFSIIGALTHMAKVGGYLLGLFLPRILAVAIPSLVVLIAAVIMHLTPNSVTSTPSYKAFEASTYESLGPVAMHGLRFVVHAEHRLFPMNNWIHQRVLFNFDFAQF